MYPFKYTASHYECTGYVKKEWEELYNCFFCLVSQNIVSIAVKMGKIVKLCCKLTYRLPLNFVVLLQKKSFGALVVLVKILV